jgi:C-terminal processing protease CtpA/Prc
MLNTLLRIEALSILAAGVALGQANVFNPSFDQGELGGVPTGWFVPPVAVKAGFGVKLVDQGCRSGRCAMMTGTTNAPQNVFGNLSQSVPAGGYNLRHIRLRSAIRVEGAQTRAQMWLRLDRADHSMAFLENMNSRPVTSSEWKTYDIETSVGDDVSSMVFGVILFGPGTAWVDDVSLSILDEVHKDKLEPARPLTEQGLTNLTAFTRLYGYVRHFHPSDQAARTDWEAFAIDGVRQVEGAASNAELIERLGKLFHPIAPSVEVFAVGKRPPAMATQTGTEIVRYQQNGVGLASAAVAYNIYKTERQKETATGKTLPKPFEADLVPGIRASVPLTLYVDSEGTLPHAPLPGPSLLYERTAEDRATRLADVVIAWNIFQHFYPYFDVVKTDWSAELPKALRTAATDSGPAEFRKTLQRLVAALKDGHGQVSYSHQGAMVRPPLTLDWVQGQFLVTRVQTGKSEGVAPGDRVLEIDGKPLEQASAEVRSLISGATTQWIDHRSADELSNCNPATRRMTLELEPYAQQGTTKTVELECASPKFKLPETYTEPRPEKITELEPGIFYVDLDRVTEGDWTAAIPELEKAKGIIFDMRGYPGQPGIEVLAHLSDTTIRSAKFTVGSAALPDRLDTSYHDGGWPVEPQKPYFSARRVFLTDGRAISYAETVMGIVEAFKLGEIVGSATAGTNGNVNPFRLPGGYNIAWTGMKVLKHDGSQHHGIGVLPTVPVARTRQGVAEGKDEVLLKGLVVVKGPEATK